MLQHQPWMLCSNIPYFVVVEQPLQFWWKIFSGNSNVQEGWHDALFNFLPWPIGEGTSQSNKQTSQWQLQVIIVIWTSITHSNKYYYYVTKNRSLEEMWQFCGMSQWWRRLELLYLTDKQMPLHNKMSLKRNPDVICKCHRKNNSLKQLTDCVLWHQDGPVHHLGLWPCHQMICMYVAKFLYYTED